VAGGTVDISNYEIQSAMLICHEHSYVNTLILQKCYTALCLPRILNP